MFWIGLLSGIVLSGIVILIVVAVFALRIPLEPIEKKDDTYYG